MICFLGFRCGHCKSLAPEWAKAAKKLESGTIPLAKVDATAATELAKEFKIQGFPTIKFFKNGKASDYSGGRTEAEIVSWVNKKGGAAAKTVSTTSELDVLVEANDASVLGVFASADSANAKAFLAWAADTELGIPLAITTSEELRNHLGFNEDTIVVHRNFEEPRVHKSVESGVDKAAVESFVVAETTPLIQEFTQQSAKKIFGSPITKHALFFTNKASDHHASVYETFTHTAKHYKGKALFVNVPATSDNQRVLDFFDIKTESLPVFVMLDMDPEGGNMKKYPFQGGALESTNINAHIEQVLAGQATPFLKSEEPTPEDTAGDVVVVKGKSFKSLVFDQPKDVFLEFYAPWCGHCKKLSPTWDELGAKYKDSNTIIAKIDATANELDVAGLQAKGFPTLYWIPGDKSKAPIKYEGARELDDLVKFVDNHSSSKKGAAHDHHDHDGHDHAHAEL